MIRFLKLVGVTAFVINLSTHAQTLEESAFVYDSTGLKIEKFLKDSRFVVDHKSSSGFEIYGPRGLKDFLRSQNLKIRDLDQDNFLNSKFGGSYPSFEEIQAGLKAFQSRYPHIVRMFSVGKSVAGRDLWFLEISRHISDTIPLPEVKYISSMHGDEITGRESMMRLIRDLLASYGKDDAITRLIDNTRIFIMPSMNPDGSYRVQRWNGNGKDLNRNFPDFSTEDNQDSAAGREPETAAIMKFQSEHHIALSANFHGGAEVVNYMWDTVSEDHPLLPLLKEVSLEYAGAVSYLKNSTEFADGITNGYAWYEVNGGMQDWSYYWHNDLQFTIELSGVKYPNYKLMDQYYQDNKNALLGFLSKVHQGAGFYFSDSNLKGSVSITSIDTQTELGTYSFTDSYFYKVLPAGKYGMKVMAEGYDPRIFLVEVKSNQIYDQGNFVRLN